MQKLLVLLVVVACVATTLAAPDSKDIKELKKEKQRIAACSKSCDAAAYKPICAGDGKAKPLSFGSECVMNNYNCEHSSSLAKISDGECPGSTGIRLS